jgi:hypothetical protein
MEIKNWSSEIESIIDETSFTLLATAKNKSWLYPIILSPILLGIIISIAYLLYYNLFFIPPVLLLSFFLFLIGAICATKVADEIPIGIDLYLYFVDNEMRYKFYNLGYIEITHPMSAINSVELSKDEEHLVIHLYKGRVKETIYISIKYTTEAKLVLKKLRTFLEYKGVQLDEN